MGEAAGTVAAHTVANHANDVHAVNADYLCRREEGAYLPEAVNNGVPV